MALISSFVLKFSSSHDMPFFLDSADAGSAVEFIFWGGEGDISPVEVKGCAGGWREVIGEKREETDDDEDLRMGFILQGVFRVLICYASLHCIGQPLMVIWQVLRMRKSAIKGEQQEQIRYLARVVHESHFSVRSGEPA